MPDLILQNPPVEEPETSAPPPSSAQAVPVRFAATSAGIPDTSGPGPVMLQQPSRWNHDFDPDTGISRASLPSETPLFFNIPAAPTPALGDSSTSLATTEFVYQTQAPLVDEAVMKSRVGSSTGFNARPGDIGEYLQVVVPPPGVELTSAQFSAVQSMELPPGDWDVYATTGFSGPSGIDVANTYYATAINETTSFPGFGGTGIASVTCASPVADTNLQCWQRRLSAQSQTIIQLAYCQFTSGRAFAYGTLAARRRR